MAIDWRNEPVLDSVQLPGSETKYWVQDTEAREKIEALASATLFIGVSTTEITDGGTEKPTINEEEVNPGVGNIVIWKPLTGAPLEFIWDGSKWNLLGGQALDGLGDLAFKNSASGSYTPAGSVTLDTTSWGAGDTNVVTDVSSNFQIHLYEGTGGIFALTSVDVSDATEFVQSISTSTIAAGFEIDAGSLPALTGITVSGLTASISNTTLVFGTGDADVSYSFNSGLFPTYSFASVTNIEDITYALAATSVTGTGTYIDAYMDGGLHVDYSGVTGTFVGSSATITVS